MEETTKAAVSEFPKRQEFRQNARILPPDGVIQPKIESVTEKENGLLGTIGVPQKFLGIRGTESIRFCTVGELCTEWFECGGSKMIVSLNLRGTEFRNVTNPSIEMLRVAEPLKK
jgi:hypothetical protein